jgi:hypothetical protein
MFDLFNAGFSNPPFFGRGLFDKAVQHYDTFAHQGAIKHAGNALLPFQSQFKQAIVKGFSMGSAQMCAHFNHALLKTA